MMTSIAGIEPQIGPHGYEEISGRGAAARGFLQSPSARVGQLGWEFFDIDYVTLRTVEQWIDRVGTVFICIPRPVLRLTAEVANRKALLDSPEELFFRRTRAQSEVAVTPWSLNLTLFLKPQVSQSKIKKKIKIKPPV